MKFILSGLLFLSTLTYANNWLDQLHQSSQKKLLSNISRSDTPKGFVVASPSKYEPNYYYHWVRDAALVMKALAPELKNTYKEKMMKDYINLVARHQEIYKITDQGEPKFNPNGSSFQEPWGRPQNDGPALRVLALIDYAFSLIEAGQKSYITQKLYASTLPAKTVIKKDLEYVSHNWMKSDFDLWEEVKGTHFYTRMVQRSALLKGAELAKKLNDPLAAKWYLSQASLIDRELKSHWSPEKKYILTTINYAGGLNYKASNLDTSVILAVNHTNDLNLSFAHDDSRVIATFNKLVKVFRSKFAINQNEKGTALGRYPEDQYYGGHPWFLLTNGAAEYLLKLRKVIQLRGKIEIDDNSQNFYNNLMSRNFKKGVITNKKTVTSIAKKLKSYAIDFLLKNKKHMGSDGQMDEQYDQNSGYMVGARDLTWSYASYLSAYQCL